MAGASGFTGFTALGSLKFDHSFLVNDFFHHASFVHYENPFSLRDYRFSKL